MKGFKDSTKTIHGHHNAPHHTKWISTESSVAKLAHGGMVREMPPQVDPNHSADRDHGNSAVDRRIPSTEELADHGGKSPLTSGFAKGGKAEKHFHVHNHYHGGKKIPKHHEKKWAEKHAMKEGGHVHDETSIPKGSPDYKKGGKVKHHNAGGAVYGTGGTIDKLATGGTVNKLATGGTQDRLAGGGMPMMGAPNRLGAPPTLGARPMPIGNVPTGGPRPPMPTVGRVAGAGRPLAPRMRMASKGGKSASRAR